MSDGPAAVEILPKELPVDGKLVVNRAQDSLPYGDFELADLVKQRRITQIKFGKDFLADTKNQVKELEKAGTEIERGLIDAFDFSKLEQESVNLELNTSEEGTDLHKFLAAVNEYDYWTKLPEDTKIELVKKPSTAERKGTGAKETFRKVGNGYIVGIDDDDMNLVTAELWSTVKKPAFDFVVARLKMVHNELSRHIERDAPMTNEEKKNFFKEWTLLKVVLGGYKIGLLSGKESPSQT